MIKTFKHKGLKKFFYEGNLSGIIPNHASKLARILDRLDASVTPQDMNLPGYNASVEREREGNLVRLGEWKLESDISIYGKGCHSC